MVTMIGYGVKFQLLLLLLSTLQHCTCECEIKCNKMGNTQIIDLRYYSSAATIAVLLFHVQAGGKPRLWGKRDIGTLW